MLFAALHAAKSPARRILLFPASWAHDASQQLQHNTIADPYLATTKRLLRIAARRFQVELRAVEGEEQHASWFAATDDEADAGLAALKGHPLGTIAQKLTDVDRVLLLRSPGWIQHAAALDAVLAYAPLAQDGLGTYVRPSGESIDAAVLSLGNLSDKHIERGTKLFASPLDALDILPLSLEGQRNNLTANVASLRLPGAHDEFDKEAFRQVAYVTFDDPRLPRGPEQDVPFSQRVAARPPNAVADGLWTGLYADFAQQRWDVCGLGLETWYGS
ncbi:hypothetical protein ANO11243_083410 [Dothideomycetidae sp. 11243]|nr:hypothetical protein ANO11243_083410 [fungal sp. No.11243]